ncbi:MAG: DNA primase [Clostridia bacterium]|nr:DNA primase [Clostridia bacterium]
MALYGEKFLDELLSKINLVDIVSRYCNLQRRGSSNYWACCPLPGHTEKTPSFTVNEPGQFYHCFGCGKGGDAIRFIQEVETVDFVDAVKILAEIAKMPLPVQSEKDAEKSKLLKNKKDRLHDILRETAIFYAKNLYDEKALRWREYLAKRGLDGKTVKVFGIGASLDYDGLPRHLKGLGYTEEEMLEAGVCQRSERGKIYDFEAERLIIPIINSMGKVIAFGGRIYEDKGFGKYKNTAETVIFNKKNNLYGINNLKKVKQEENFDKVIMVEGYMDAISLYMAGFKNVVASMGTSLTLQQAKLLKRYATTVLVSYDGDSAGQNATIRSLDIFENEGFEVKVVSLPDGLDPDDVIRKYGKEGYQTLLNNAQPLIDYKLSLIENGKDLQDVSERRKYVQESLELIRTVKDEFLKEELVKKVSQTSEISYASLKRDLESGTVTVKPTQKKEEIVVKRVKNNATSLAERVVLWAYVNDKDYAHDKDLQLLNFTDSTRDTIAEHLVYDEAGTVKPRLYKIVGDEGLAELDAILSCGDIIPSDESDHKRYFYDCYNAVRKHNLAEDVKRLNELYKLELNQEAKLKYAELIAQKMEEIKNV